MSKNNDKDKDESIKDKLDRIIERMDTQISVMQEILEELKKKL